jgi:hypothetical protein
MASSSGVKDDMACVSDSRFSAESRVLWVRLLGVQDMGQHATVERLCVGEDRRENSQRRRRREENARERRRHVETYRRSEEGEDPL